MKVTLDPDFYTGSAIEMMACQFSEYLSVECAYLEGLCLTITVGEDHKQHSALIINSFLNNILELSLQELISHEC